jgi:hypothetical protein
VSTPTAADDLRTRLRDAIDSHIDTGGILIGDSTEAVDAVLAVIRAELLAILRDCDDAMHVVYAIDALADRIAPEGDGDG